MTSLISVVLCILPLEMVETVKALLASKLVNSSGSFFLTQFVCELLNMLGYACKVHRSKTGNISV